MCTNALADFGAVNGQIVDDKGVTGDYELEKKVGGVNGYRIGVVRG